MSTARLSQRSFTSDSLRRFGLAKDARKSQLEASIQVYNQLHTQQTSAAAGMPQQYMQPPVYFATGQQPSLMRESGRGV
jgi:polyadenylate-binding protein